MGAVKQDIHKGEYEWFLVNLSTRDSVKGLLKYRSQYDLLFGRGNSYDLETTNTDLNKYVKEILCLYSDLDRCIELANLTETQKIILDMFVSGYTVIEIGTHFKQSQQNISKKIDGICQAISDASNDLWHINVYKKKKLGDMKVCKQCSTEYPKTSRYFDKHNATKDGLYAVCKKCRKRNRSVKNED